MQRYRVNFPLLAGLVIAVVVGAPAAWLLWRFQVNRNAVRLLDQAEVADKAGEVEDEFDSLSQYVRLRRDDVDAQLKLGRAAVKVAKLEDADRDLISKAYFSLVEAVLRTNNHELRRELVNLHLAYGYLDRALEAIDVLIAEGKGDHELMALKAECLFQAQDTGKALQWGYEVIGYSPQTGKFDMAKGRAPDQPMVYGRLAQYLYQSQQKELAEKIIDQLIEANPKSRDAYLIRYRLLKGMFKPEESRAALEKAYELEPDDADVLLSKGIESIADYQVALGEAAEAEVGEESDKLRKQADESLDEATKFFAQGLEKYPDYIDFYTYSARIEMFRKRLDKALVIINRGLKKFELGVKTNALGIPTALELANLKVDLLFSQGDVEGVRAVVKELRDLKNARLLPVADFHEAKLDMQQGNLAEAARRFGAAKVRLAGLQDLQVLAAMSKAQCHVQMNQYDLAGDEYDWIIERFPNYEQAKLAKADIDRMLNRSNEDGTALQLDALVDKMLEQPEERQDWSKLDDQIDAYVEEQAKRSGQAAAWTEAHQELLKAQVFLTRASKATDANLKKRLYAEATAATTRAYEANPTEITVQLAGPRVRMLDPASGPAEALKMLDDILAKNAEKDVKESLPFRLLRIDILYAMQGEDLSNQLHATTTNMEDWDAAQQAEVWKKVGAMFQQLGRFQDATLCLEEAAKLAPYSLPIRMDLFEIARSQVDDEAMLAAQEDILEIVKDKAEPDYVITEVKRLMVNFGAERITNDELKQARTLLNEAIRRRPGWADLYILSGSLALVLELDRQLALENFEKALENGPANINALNLQVRLLADMGRFADARKIMDRLPADQWSAILDRAAATVLRNVGENERAFEEAKKLVDTRPKDPDLQVWFAEVAGAANKPEAAEAALQAAVKINPANPEFWSGLLNFYTLAQRFSAVELTLRQAELALDEEFLPLLTAHQHRISGRFPEAEAIMLSSFRDTIDKVDITQRMADFYLTWSEADARARARMRGPNAIPEIGGTQAIRDKAIPLLNKILRAAYEGKAEPTNPAVAWARRQAARILSLSGDYQDSLKAEKMLANAVAKGVATPEGQEMLIEILKRRNDPDSFERTIALLQDIQKERGLSPPLELQLGEALASVGRWDESQRHMQDAIARHPKDVALRVGLIEQLIERKDAARAETWLRRLEDVEDGDKAIPQLRILLAAGMDQKDELRKLLEQATPNLSAALTAQQLSIIHAVALLAERVGDTDYALKLITEYSRRVPGNELELAHYTAMYGDVEAGLAMLKEQFPANIDTVLSTAIEVLRTRRTENPELLDAEISRLVSRARADDSEAARRMVLEAESLEVQQKFDEAVAAYRALLARDDVPRFVRATAQNNLSFLLAMMKQDLDQALAGVNEAIEIIGPISDILDTRALVYLHSGEFVLAVKDLQAAVKVNATASKYFHLAEALLGVGDEASALVAWKEAEARGISVDKIPEVERPDFEKTLKKIDVLRGKTTFHAPFVRGSAAHAAA